MGLSVAALVVTLAVTAFAWFSLTHIRGAFFQAKNHTVAVDLSLIVIGLIPVALLWPVFRAITNATASSVALARGDLIDGRVKNAASRGWAWYALGYAFAALIVFALGLFVVLNETAVGKTFFRLDIITGTFGLVAGAFWTNVQIFLIAEVFILIWGLVIAVARLIPGRAGQPIRFLATAYTDIFRGLPSIITIYLVGFGLPLTDLPVFKDLTPFTSAILALTLTYAAYVAEVYRAGIESIHPSQFSAARSLGLSFGQTMRFVIIPQAVRRIIPPLLNDFIGLQKDTALVQVVGTIDAFNQSKIIASNRFNLSSVTTVAILFVLITIPQARFVDRLLEREQRKISR